MDKKKSCPEGKVLNVKTNRCNKIKTRKARKPKIKTEKVCNANKEFNPHTKRCVNKCKTGYSRDDKFRCKTTKTRKVKAPEEEWNEAEWKEIIANLKEGKLKNKMIIDKPPTLDCKECIKKLSTTELQQELDSRKKSEAHINILIPRKKVK